jgi:hypothetical protein
MIAKVECKLTKINEKKVEKFIAEYFKYSVEEPQIRKAIFTSPLEVKLIASCRTARCEVTIMYEDCTVECAFIGSHKASRNHRNPAGHLYRSLLGVEQNKEMARKGTFWTCLPGPRLY